MTDEYMTLAEALATKLPFKHKDGSTWYREGDVVTFTPLNIYEPVWQVQRPKVSYRVWKNGGELLFTKENPTGWNDGDDWVECTKDLAEALAPLLKEILKEGGE